MNILKKYKDLLAESLKDNKKLIIGLYIFFIVCAVVAGILYAAKVQAFVGRMNASNSTAVAQNVTALELFINNELVGIQMSH